MTEMKESENIYPDKIEQKNVKRSFFQFIFPFQLEDDRIKGFAEKLLEKGFVFFDLNNADDQDRFYGDDAVSHRAMEKFFMPYIEPIIFPPGYLHRQSMRRFTKTMNTEYDFTAKYLDTKFMIHSFDITLCPFHIGLMTIRVSLPDNMDYSDVLFFADHFRVLEPIADTEQSTKITCSEEESYKTVKDFIFNQLLTVLKDYIDDDSGNSTYFGSLPFFIDERMYVVGHIRLEEDCEIERTDLFRAGELDGLDDYGKPYISARNPKYIDRYFEQNVRDRWGDETYYVSSLDAFVCLTRADGEMEKQLAGQMYGEFYYTVLLYYYYKIVLLKLTHLHADINIEKDQSNTELLIVMITEFSAKYFFPEVNSSTYGKEIFLNVRDLFGVESLYTKVKETLDGLYQNQDQLSGKRSGYLLEILTIYSTISGIFGMNLVIDSLKGDIPWSEVSHYSIYEYLALFVTISGVVISVSLGTVFVRNWLKERKSRRSKIL